MAKVAHYYTKFEEGKFYHIYNRSVDRRPMFKNDGNYQYFLKQFDHYLSEVLDVYAYCLLGNHFHFLIKVRDLENFRVQHDVAEIKLTHEIISKKFRHFFQSYAMAFNKQHQRVGTLFQTPFKRALVDEQDYLVHMVDYIHNNPQNHALTTDFRNWRWSSYHEISGSEIAKVKKRRSTRLVSRCTTF